MKISIQSIKNCDNPAHLRNSYDSNDVVVLITSSGGIDKKVPSLIRLGSEFQLIVGCLPSLKRILHNLLDGLPQFRHNERRYKRLVERFFLGEASDLSSLVIPLVYHTIDIDTENRGVGCIDQLPKFSSHGRHSPIMLRCFRHILGHAYDSNDIIVSITAGGGIHKQVPGLIGLGAEFQLVVGRFSALESIIQDLLDGAAQLRNDKSLHQWLIESFLLV